VAGSITRDGARAFCYVRRSRETRAEKRLAVKKKQKQTILAKVNTAATEVSESVTDLDRLLSDLASAPRAEKTTISKIVEDAFSRLKNARLALTEVQKLLEKEKEEE
jgi:hypothetical protein